MYHLNRVIIQIITFVTEAFNCGLIHLRTLSYIKMMHHGPFMRLIDPNPEIQIRLYLDWIRLYSAVILINVLCLFFVAFNFNLLSINQSICKQNTQLNNFMCGVNTVQGLYMFIVLCFDWFEFNGYLFCFSYLLGLLAKIKCSISSSQPDL